MTGGTLWTARRSGRWAGRPACRSRQESTGRFPGTPRTDPGGCRSKAASTWSTTGNTTASERLPRVERAHNPVLPQGEVHFEDRASGARGVPVEQVGLEAVSGLLGIDAGRGVRGVQPL